MKIKKTLKKIERELDCALNIKNVSSDDKQRYNVNVVPTIIINNKIFSQGYVPTDREITKALKPILEEI